jgi:hypothetical protein
LLVNQYGESNVLRQVRVTPYWIVDFYVSSIDTYIQFDGVYWHGLDRPIEQIKESGTFGHIRDASIYRKWCVDRQQDKWFLETGKKLVRITDQELKSDSQQALKKVEMLDAQVIYF